MNQNYEYNASGDCIASLTSAPCLIDIGKIAPGSFLSILERLKADGG